jgi:CHASE3 domain sensor protein
MSNAKPRSTLPRGPGLDLSLGLAAVMLFFVATGIVGYFNTRSLTRTAEEIVHTHTVILALEEIMSIMKDAETGQRGFVITGDDRYLEPYTVARARIDERLNNLKQLTAENSNQSGRIPTIEAQVNIKLKELADTIELRRRPVKGFEAARDVVVTDRGKAAMDAIRTQIDAMEQTEREVRTQRIAEMNDAYRLAVGSGILTTLLGVLISGLVAYLVRRAILTRRRQEWLQTGLVGLSQVTAGDKRIDQLGDGVIKFLAEYVGAHAAAFFTKQGEVFRRAATYGVPIANGAPELIGPGDGLLAQAARDGRPFLLTDVPAGYLTLGSALGRSAPRSLYITPARIDDAVIAVMEFGFLDPLADPVSELLEQASGVVGTAVRSAQYRAHLQNLLEETQRQSEELQAQGEELRVTNEELEEQGRALKESHARLEQQQAELEQTNEQLEEQAQILEGQRDNLSRATTALKTQAQELEQASRYKSDFLANMSHELRTPLNSSLILAKLLADNPQGNLNEEQVRFAETIRSAGNDLLALINDILDLSKIEAGHVVLHPGPIRLAHLVEDLGRTFEPIARQKELAYRAQLAAGCPEVIETDRQRLEQILKNLLSNAFKFTETGEVTLTSLPATGRRPTRAAEARAGATRSVRFRIARARSIVASPGKSAAQCPPPAPRPASTCTSCTLRRWRRRSLFEPASGNRQCAGRCR